MLDEWESTNLKIARKTYEEEKRIAPAMKEEYSRVAGECEFVWRTARKNNDFKQLAPHLDQLFTMTRQMGQVKADHFDKKPYDILLDAYNPDFTDDAILEIYTVLKAELPGLIQQIIANQATEKVVPLTEPIDIPTQRAIGLKVLEKMDFSLMHGRLDESAHPFCNGSNDDVRLTTRYSEANFLSGLTARSMKQATDSTSRIFLRLTGTSLWAAKKGFFFTRVSLSSWSDKRPFLLPLWNAWHSC